MRRRRALGIVLAAAASFQAAAARADTPVVPPLDAGGAHRASHPKNQWAALAWELIPGAGSLYADDARGAVITWALIGGGLAAALIGLSQLQLTLPDGPDPMPSAHGDSPFAMPLLLGGTIAAVAGRIYGLQNAAAAVDRYNAAHDSAISVGPFLTPGTGGLSLAGRF